MIKRLCEILQDFHEGYVNTRRAIEACQKVRDSPNKTNVTNKIYLVAGYQTMLKINRAFRFGKRFYLTLHGLDDSLFELNDGKMKLKKRRY